MARNGPLVEIDAGAIPASLFESELFGYAAGAFTGAEEGFDGRVARAAGGSLLLDHVEEIPLAVQPKLLRLLAEGRYAPLGGDEVEADVRFVTIGAPDLPERVAQGAFRDPQVLGCSSPIGSALDVAGHRAQQLGDRSGRLRLQRRIPPLKDRTPALDLEPDGVLGGVDDVAHGLAAGRLAQRIGIMSGGEASPLDR